MERRRLAPQPFRRRRGPGWRGAGAAAAIALAATVGAWAPGATAGARGSGTPAGAVVGGQPAPPGSGSLSGVACGSASDCWATGTAAPGGKGAAHVALDATVDGGRTWKVERVAVPGPASLTAVGCAGPKACMAVGTVSVGGASLGLALATTDRGRHWKVVHAPTGSTDVVAVDCTAPGRCTALVRQGAGYWAASTGTGGAEWQRLGTLPPGVTGITSLACAGAATCLAAGNTPTTPGHGAGTVVVSDDGGTVWTTAGVPPGGGPLHDVACPSPSDCVAVGTKATTTIGVAQGDGEVLVSTDGGGTWSTATPPGAVGDAFGLACGSASSCAVVGTGWTDTEPPGPTGSVATSTDGGGTWQAAAAHFLPVGLVAVACPSPTACVAAGNDELARITLPRSRRHHAPAR